MKMKYLAVAMAMAAGSTGMPAVAQIHTHAMPAKSQADAFAPVYVVSSRKTFKNIESLVRNGKSQRDSLGNELVVSETVHHKLIDITETIHQREQRCGGYFAFKSRKEAEDFIASDQSATIATAAVASYTIDNQDTVDPWLDDVSESNIYDSIDHLQGYTNRYYASTTGKEAAEWIHDTWKALGGSRTDFTTELYTDCTDCSTQPSVIMTVHGSDETLKDEVVIVGAHLDSINSSGAGSSTQIAPGADDDASGIATITEVIRVAMESGWKPKRTIKFMGYAAEEVGLRGSKSIAQKFKNDAVKVVGVLQLDMTNYKSGTPEDMQLVTDNSNADLKVFLENLFDEYLEPLGLTRGTITCGYGCSDHASWNAAGFPAAMMFEAGDDRGKDTSSFTGYNPKIHSTGDTLSNMGESAAPSVNFAKLGLAFIGELGKTAGGVTPPANQAPVANFTSSANGLTVAFTDASSDSDGAIASRSWDFGDGTTSTSTNPSKTYGSAGTYTVKLTVTDDDGASATKSASVTVTAPSATLSNGVAKTGISGAKGSQQYWTLEVPSGAANLKFVTSGGSTGQDVDLYVKAGSKPTTSTADCKSEGATTSETCTIASVQAGTYHVMLYGYTAYSGITLKASYTQKYINDTDVAISDNATSQSTITVTGRSGKAPNNASVSVNISHSFRGDLKVELVAPDGSAYHLKDYNSNDSADNVVATYTKDLSTETLNGDWKLKVHDGWENDTGKIDSWSLQF